MLITFITLQFILLLFMLFHDWVSIPPLTNIPALKAASSNSYLLLGSVINGTSVIIPLIITLLYFTKTHIPLLAAIIVTDFYFVLTVGTILSWWTPYFFGSSSKHKTRFAKFKDTHHFLPARGDNVIPNTLHVILHLQVWACLAISLYFLFR